MCINKVFENYEKLQAKRKELQRSYSFASDHSGVGDKNNYDMTYQSTERIFKHCFVQGLAKIFTSKYEEIYNTNQA